jgi:hypothetical protein
MIQKRTDWGQFDLKKPLVITGNMTLEDFWLFKPIQSDHEKPPGEEINRTLG